jgi:hypothetical protein
MSNPADCTIGDSVQVKKYNMVKYESLSVYQIDSYLIMLYIFTCTEAHVVQSAGFDIFYLIY